MAAEQLVHVFHNLYLAKVRLRFRHKKRTSGFILPTIRHDNRWKTA